MCRWKVGESEEGVEGAGGEGVGGLERGVPA